MRGKATSWYTTEVALQLVAPSWVSLSHRFCYSAIPLVTEKTKDIFPDTMSFTGF